MVPTSIVVIINVTAIVLTSQQNFRLFSKSVPDALSHCDTILSSIRSSADEKPPKPGTASLLGARAGSWLAHSPTVVGEAKSAFGPGDAS